MTLNCQPLYADPTTAVSTLTANQISTNLQDGFSPWNPQSNVLISIASLGSCLSTYSLADFNSLVQASVSPSLSSSPDPPALAYSNTDLVGIQLSEDVVSTVYSCVPALILAFAFFALSVRGLWATILLAFCIGTSLIISAGLTHTWGYTQFSAFNIISIFILVGVGANFVLVFDCAWSDKLPRGAKLTPPLFLDIYSACGGANTLTLCAAALSLFSSLLSPIMVVSQLGSFLGVAVVVFYLQLHTTLIPFWVISNRFPFPSRKCQLSIDNEIRRSVRHEVPFPFPCNYCSSPSSCCSNPPPPYTSPSDFLSHVLYVWYGAGWEGLGWCWFCGGGSIGGEARSNEEPLLTSTAAPLSEASLFIGYKPPNKQQKTDAISHAFPQSNSSIPLDLAAPHEVSPSLSQSHFNLEESEEPPSQSSLQVRPQPLSSDLDSSSRPQPTFNTRLPTLPVIRENDFTDADEESLLADLGLGLGSLAETLMGMPAAFGIDPESYSAVNCTTPRRGQHTPSESELDLIPRSESPVKSPPTSTARPHPTLNSETPPFRSHSLTPTTTAVPTWMHSNRALYVDDPETSEENDLEMKLQASTSNDPSSFGVGTLLYRSLAPSRKTSLQARRVERGIDDSDAIYCDEEEAETEDSDQEEETERTIRPNNQTHHTQPSQSRPLALTIIDAFPFSVISSSRTKGFERAMIVIRQFGALFVCLLILGGATLNVYYYPQKFSLNLGTPQLFLPSTNLGQLMTIIQLYKPSLVTSNSEISIPSPAPAPSASPPSPISSPALSPTVSSTLVSPSSVSYTVYACYGLSYIESHKDSNVEPEPIPRSDFSDYQLIGLRQDTSTLCSNLALYHTHQLLVNAHAPLPSYSPSQKEILSLNLALDLNWNHTRDCIYDQFLVTHHADLSGSPKSITDLVLLSWLSKYPQTAPSLLGVDPIPSSSTLSANNIYPRWICSNYTMTTPSSLISDQHLAIDLLNSWTRLVSLSSLKAESMGVPLLVTSEAFTLPVLAHQLVWSVQVAGMFFGGGLAFLLLVWSRNLTLTILTLFVSAVLVVLSMGLHIWIFDSVIDLLDVVVWVAVAAIVVDYPIHTLEDFLLERERELKRIEGLAFVNEHERHRRLFEAKRWAGSRYVVGLIFGFEFIFNPPSGPAPVFHTRRNLFSPMGMLVILGYMLSDTPLAILNKTSSYIFLLALVSYWVSLFIFPWLLTASVYLALPFHILIRFLGEGTGLLSPLPAPPARPIVPFNSIFTNQSTSSVPQPPVPPPSSSSVPPVPIATAHAQFSPPAYHNLLNPSIPSSSSYPTPLPRPALLPHSLPLHSHSSVSYFSPSPIPSLSRTPSSPIPTPFNTYWSVSSAEDEEDANDEGEEEEIEMTTI